MLSAPYRHPAKVLGKLDSMGTIEVGKLADFVLLDANPLADIANTQRIRAVVANGLSTGGPGSPTVYGRAVQHAS